jgi:CO/xanthine dehydrogenase FAD-binding subunit
MPLTHLQTYHRPNDLQSAVDLIQAGAPQVRLMAAGTDLVLHGTHEITGLVDLSGLDLSYIEGRDNGIAIGAMTTLTDLMEHPVLNDYLGGIVPAVLRHVGSPLLRNLATIGGNLVRRQPWSDVVPLFLALGATVRHFDGTEHEETLAELYGKPGHTPEDILIEVVLPVPKPTAAAAFEKFTRSVVDIAVLNCVVFVRSEHERCVEARVYVGGTPRSAAAVPAVVEKLQGRSLDDEVISEAAQIAAAEVPTGNDRRTTAAYRTHLVEVGLGRCLRRIAKEVGAA